MKRLVPVSALAVLSALGGLAVLAVVSIGTGPALAASTGSPVSPVSPVSPLSSLSSPSDSPSSVPLTGPAATGEYQCALTGTGAETVAATLQLASAPIEAHPGQRVPLKGQLSLDFPSTEQIKSALLLATQFGISGADFPVTAESGKHSSVVKVVSASGPQVPAGTPFIVTAKVVLAPFTVPSGAREVDLGLPTAATVTNPLDQVSSALGSVPSKVAFTVTLDEGGLVGTRQVACWLGSNKASAPIVQIPVSPRVRTSEPGTGAGGPGSSGGPAPVQTAPAANDVLPPVTAPVTAPGQGPRPGTTPVGTTQLEPTYAAIPPATRGQGIFIPSWALALLGLLIPVSAVAYAVATHLKLKRASGGA